MFQKYDEYINVVLNRHFPPPWGTLENENTIRTKPRGRHQTNRLTAQFVRTAGPGLYGDGHGLNLRVDPAGARRWEQRLVVGGQPRTLGLGGYPLVSLAEARDKAFANRRLARTGGDTLAEKKKSKTIPTFEDAAARTIAVHRAGWKDPRREAQLWHRIRTYAAPHLGGRRIDEIASADVSAVLTPIWHA